jgi:acyl-[acyl-carrier-protein] desaturase
MMIDIGTGRDPYKNLFILVSELATYVSHNRVAQMAKKYGDKLSKNVR